MKKINLLLLVFVISCSQPNTCPELEYKNGLTYLNDRLYTGRCSILYDNGNLSGVQSYVDGLDHGKWKYYYQDGTLETKGKFDKGKRIGKWKYYHPNKKIKQISNYNRLGEKEGIWKYYDEKGTLIEDREN